MNFSGHWPSGAQIRSDIESHVRTFEQTVCASRCNGGAMTKQVRRAIKPGNESKPAFW
jgi:hypothetical protein